MRWGTKVPRRAAPDGPLPNRRFRPRERAFPGVADEEGIEAAAFGEGLEDARDPTQVDRVLHRTAPDDNADGDGPGGPRRYPMFCP